MIARPPLVRADIADWKTDAQFDLVLAVNCLQFLGNEAPRALRRVQEFGRTRWRNWIVYVRARRRGHAAARWHALPLDFGRTFVELRRIGIRLKRPVCGSGAAIKPNRFVTLIAQRQAPRQVPHT